MVNPEGAELRSWVLTLRVSSPARPCPHLCPRLVVPAAEAHVDMWLVVVTAADTWKRPVAATPSAAAAELFDGMARKAAPHGVAILWPLTVAAAGCDTAVAFECASSPQTPYLSKWAVRRVCTAAASATSLLQLLRALPPRGGSAWA